MLSQSSHTPSSLDMPGSNITLLGVKGQSWLKHLPDWASRFPSVAGAVAVGDLGVAGIDRERKLTLVITRLVCEEKVETWRGDIRVERRCGAEHQARTGQLVEEPICGLLSTVD
jgi:hypothetical protein